MVPQVCVQTRGVANNTAYMLDVCTLLQLASLQVVQCQQTSESLHSCQQRPSLGYSVSGTLLYFHKLLQNDCRAPLIRQGWLRGLKSYQLQACTS